MAIRNPQNYDIFSDRRSPQPDFSIERPSAPLRPWPCRRSVGVLIRPIFLRHQARFRFLARQGAARHPKTGACFDNYRRAADSENYSAPQSLAARLGNSARPRGAACLRWAGDAAHRWSLPGEKTPALACRAAPIRKKKPRICSIVPYPSTADRPAKKPVESAI